MSSTGPDHLRVSVHIASSQRPQFDALGYVPGPCTGPDRLPFRLGATCMTAEDLPAGQVGSFVKRFGLTPTALCEAARKTAAELGVKMETDADRPEKVRRLRAEIRARARHGLTPPGAEK